MLVINKDIKSRVLNEASHVINTKDTIRVTADKFNVSKSTVYNDLSDRLKKLDNDLSKKINNIFKTHDKYKHIRGGEVTKNKYKRGLK